MSAPARSRDEGSWEVITAALDRAVGPGRPSGAWTKYCCPAHEGDGRGHKPSLGVKYDSGEQRTVVRCFAGCDNELVLDTLGLKVRDMFDRDVERTRGRDRHANRPRPRQVSPADRAIDAAGLPLIQPKKPDLGEQVSPWTRAATYPYVRADGSVAGEVVRQEARFERGRDKQFHQRHWNERTGRMESGGFEPIPYQLPRVLDAVAEGRVVYIVEGEKDVAAAESAGLTATTNAGGAMVWNAEHAKWLSGAATVVIVADHDTAGYRRAEKVMATLDGQVGRVRVVQAATGKDLHDHLQAGHEIGELVPVPHLDPYTADATTSAASAVSSDPTPTSGGSSVPDYMLAPSLHDGPAPSHSDEVDTMAAQWAMFVKLIVTWSTARANHAAEQRRLSRIRDAERSEDERRQDEARYGAEKAAVEVRLTKLADAGLDKASRSQIVAAVGDAIGWAPESEVAHQAARQLISHVRTRFGVEIDLNDPADPNVKVVVPPNLATALMAAEQERAGHGRLRKAQERMAELVAAESLDESVKAELYADIEAWRANPTAQQLDSLSKKLQDKGVGQPARTKVRFVAAYLGTPGQLVPLDQLGEVDSANATRELRRLGEPLVDPGDEVKPRVDELLVRYQDAVRVGGPTESLRARLSESIAVMTPQEQAAARERGAAIRANPGETFQRLWPEYVDRDELATSLRVYAVLAPQAELAAGGVGDLDDDHARSLQAQAHKQRAAINAAKKGKGLHEWERDQIDLVMADVEAGKTNAPELMFADDRSGAAVDADRAVRIAQDTSLAHRRQLEDILETNAAPAGTVRRSRDAVTRVMDVQTELAAGRAGLPDYEATGLDRQLDAKLAAVGVPEPVRNRVRRHVDFAAGEAAIVGKQANNIADRWGARREAVVAAREPATAAAPVYDSPARREGLEANLRAITEVDEDTLAQRMAADAGHATPASAAPKAARRNPRRTTPGAGANLGHRRRGRGPDKGLGL